MSIWVLVDDRTGNSNQAIALAEILGEDFLIHHIEYNALANLPSMILKFLPYFFTTNFLSELSDSTQLPKLIITAGRRTSLIALYCKKILLKRYNHEVKLVQIMRPACDYQDFDLIILPEHDHFPKASNILRITGAISNIALHISSGAAEFAVRHPAFQRHIAVMVGGVSKAGALSEQDFCDFADVVLCLGQRYQLPIFISFSRRTSFKIKKYFAKIFQAASIEHIVFFDPKSEFAYNPYPAMLGQAEYILCSGDSISMCSEAASLGKRLYIFCSSALMRKSCKHQKFLANLAGSNRALLIGPDCAKLEEYQPNILSEHEVIKNIVHLKMDSKKNLI
jgi:mitochondrial fission protein ELM1